jgi:hypothetical protein
VFDAQEYASFLNSLDIVLIPYTTENYHSQTSGIYAEAVAIGAGTVVPKGTWMARQLGRFGGGRAFNPGDAEDFCATVIDTCQMYPSLSRKAAERANEWHAVHNAEAFLDRVNVRAA